MRTASGQWRIFALQGRGQTIAVAQPTAVRARFYPGEDRKPLAEPAAEARRLLDLAGV